MRPTYELRPLTALGRVPRDVTALHAALLPHSPVVLLGPRFMQHFYYKTLVAEGVICGAIAYVDAEPAGFIAVTMDSTGFLREALKRHPWRLAWLLGTSIWRDLRRIAALWEAWRIMRGQPRIPVEGNVGEILSFGVLPAFRRPGFIRDSGLKISLELLQYALQELQNRGARLIRVVVDEDNLEARLFYQSQGWRLRSERVPGWRKPAVEYSWPQG